MIVIFFFFFAILGSLTLRHTVQVLLLLGLSEPRLGVTANVTLLLSSPLKPLNIHPSLYSLHSMWMLIDPPATYYHC